MAAEAVYMKSASSPFRSAWSSPSRPTRVHTHKLQGTTLLASASSDGRNKVDKELGLFSLKKKIEDAVRRAELMAPTALEREEAMRIKREKLIRSYDLWDDPAKSNDILVKLAGSARVVDALKDLTYKAEEAKLITQLAEMDAINDGLFGQAYTASLDVSKSLDRYEMLRLLKGPYDAEGASLVIKARSDSMNHQLWAGQLLTMYTRWAEKQGHAGRIVEKSLSKNGGISSATIEFEFEYAFGHLQGERGVHSLIRSSEYGSANDEVSSVAVDVTPLFLGASSDLQINEVDLETSCATSPKEEFGGSQSRVVIQHIPTGIVVECSGERSQFANKIKALNRLKARLLIILNEQGVSNVSSINREGILDVWKDEVRRYICYPYKLVKDERTGLELSDLSSILDGNIEPLVGAHIHMRHFNGMI